MQVRNILQIQNIFVERVFCSFLREQNFWKIYSINIYGRVSDFLIYDQKKVFSNGKHSDSQIFHNTQRLGFQFLLLLLLLLFYRYIIAHTFKNIKTLSPGTNILGVPGKKTKRNS